MTGDRARYWRRDALPGTELLAARFVRHAFARHAHAEYAIGAIVDGVEEWDVAGGTMRAGAGSLVFVNPEVPHNGRAGVPEGWSYRIIYPDVATVRAVAAELGRPGTPWFRESVVADPGTHRLLVAAVRAADRGDDLAASSAQHAALVALLGLNAGTAAPASAPAPRAVDRARELLHARLTAPPTLAELAEHVGLGPHVLQRAFRTATGLPPHAYLVQERVRRARSLLAAGDRPAEVAAAVGFADQAHLTRHFRRYLGVPPGAYRKNVQDRGAREA
ncbi:AraC family transcriptional regulator [Longispora fulva]|uniref:AraC-like DNA-binding protein n=1 Tax=Longispora fulva TaxID=619741 RepID=A0A8J7GMV4_9ACTN|nr:AraC family transcriptional regulator [Longispora fulva]MBG6141281.1 AraC-like DNA-binding protein [Longispora fulva]GIG62722.1 AraC family transcriptional regulator [Longispora fulva]